MLIYEGSKGFKKNMSHELMDQFITKDMWDV